MKDYIRSGEQPNQNTDLFFDDIEFQNKKE